MGAMNASRRAVCYTTRPLARAAAGGRMGIGRVTSARRAALLALALLTLVLLVARAFGPLAAAFAIAPLALDPWLVAHGQLLHLDGLFASLVAICVLACLVRWQAAGGARVLVLAGLAAGLAALTKSAAL